PLSHPGPTVVHLPTMNVDSVPGTAATAATRPRGGSGTVRVQCAPRSLDTYTRSCVSVGHTSISDSLSAPAARYGPAASPQGAASRTQRWPSPVYAPCPRVSTLGGTSTAKSCAESGVTASAPTSGASSAMLHVRPPSWETVTCR